MTSDLRFISISSLSSHKKRFFSTNVSDEVCRRLPQLDAIAFCGLKEPKSAHAMPRSAWAGFAGFN